jgi:hypothetical protein
MFYYGLSNDGHARDGVAFSGDLLHWQKVSEVLVDIGLPGSIDSQHAHKPSIFWADGRLYHYYCAVEPATHAHFGDVTHDEVRGIAVATSQTPSGH